MTAAAAAEQARESDEVRPPAPRSGAALLPPEERVLGMPASSPVDELVGVSGAMGPVALDVGVNSKPAAEEGSMIGI